jgi:hypothetical protein
MPPPAQQNEQNMKTNARGRQNNAARDRGGQSSIILSGYDSVIAGLRSLRSLRLILSPLSGPVRVFRVFRGCSPSLLRQANWEVKVPKFGTLTSHHKGDN